MHLLYQKNAAGFALYCFLLALMLKHNMKGKALFRTIFYLPSIVPAVATATIFMWLLNPDIGLFNQILKAVGLPTSQ